MPPSLPPKSPLTASILQKGLNRASLSTPRTWPGCATGCRGQKHKVHLPSCAQKYFQLSQREVLGKQSSSRAQCSWLPAPETWSDPTAFGSFCFANTTLVKLNLFCHQELHDQLRRGNICVSASPSGCWVLMRQVSASNLNKRSYPKLYHKFPEFPRSLFSPV